MQVRCLHECAKWIYECEMESKVFMCLCIYQKFVSLSSSLNICVQRWAYMLTHCLPKPCPWSVVSKYPGVVTSTSICLAPIVWCSNNLHVMSVPIRAPSTFCFRMLIVSNEPSQRNLGLSINVFSDRFCIPAPPPTIPLLACFFMWKSCALACPIVHICSIFTTFSRSATCVFSPPPPSRIRALTFIVLSNYCPIYAMVTRYWLPHSFNFTIFFNWFLGCWGNSDKNRDTTSRRWVEGLRFPVQVLVPEVFESNTTGRVTCRLNSMISPAVCSLPCNYLE